jgi:uncharacterized membrane protein (DUF106 family)
LVTAPIFKALYEFEREGTDVDFDNLSRKTEGDEFMETMIPMILMNSSLHGSNEHYVAEECVSTFRLMKIEHRIAELKRELAIAEREQDSEKLSKLSAEQIQLTAQGKQIQLTAQGKVMIWTDLPRYAKRNT